MTKKEFNKLKFSQRHVISKGIKCSASWQVQQVGGDAGYFISCRECGTMLQSDCTPKCLLHETPPTEINTVLCKPEASASADVAAVGQRSVGTVTEGMEVTDIKTGQILNVEGYGFMFGRVNTGEIQCFNIGNVSELSCGE